jgi:ADP-heptose:LPS heptosyltransferase
MCIENTASPLRRPNGIPFRKRLRAFFNRVFDRLVFPFWLAAQRLRFGKKLILICRTGALGDIICTLPLCGELRKRHPGLPLVFVTHGDYKSVVLLGRVADAVYGAKSWAWPFALPASYRLPGLVEAIYNAQTTDERCPQKGVQAHLIDDLAASCGVSVPQTNRQPHLFPAPAFIRETQASHGVAAGRLLIGINGGQTWPVRMWDVARWQELVDKIHAEWEADVLQFGFSHGSQDPYEHLRGVHRFKNWMESAELVALIASCRLMISIESGPVHVAGAVGVPVVGLYGAVNPGYRLPPETPAVGVTSNVPCLFCHHTSPRGHWQTGCPNDIRCMKELDTQTVFEAVKQLLQKAA